MTPSICSSVLKRRGLWREQQQKRRSICEANLNPTSRCKIRNANCFCGTRSKIPAFRFESKHQIEFNVILVNPLIFCMQNISASVRFNFGYLHADRARFRFYLLHTSDFCFFGVNKTQQRKRRWLDSVNRKPSSQGAPTVYTFFASKTLELVWI